MPQNSEQERLNKRKFLRGLVEEAFDRFLGTSSGPHTALEKSFNVSKSQL